MKDNKFGVPKTTGAMNMNEINEEIILTLNLMQSNNCEGTLKELQKHLNGLLEIKRNEYKQRLVERYWADSPAPYKSVKIDLQFGDPDKPLTVDEWMAGLAIVTDNDVAKPLTAEELRAGGWCVDSSEECMRALVEKGLGTLYHDWPLGEGYKYYSMSGFIIVVTPMQAHNAELKQINRIGSEFYWSDK